jgi:acyl-CoA synthetase (AMP-forming)/AMP-acid ligase II/acyl carrier protein
VEYQTLTQALEARAAGEASVTFLDSGNRERSVLYRSLYERAQRVLHFLQSEGVRRGDELVLCVAHNQALIDALWACLLGGIVPVPLAPGNNSEHRRKVLGVLAMLRKPVLFTDRGLLDRLAADAAEHDAQRLLAGTRTLLRESITHDAQSGVVHRASADDVALVQFSSGSTGDPKGVVLTHKNVLSNIRDMRDGAHVSGDDSFLNWMPLTHDMGLVGFHFFPLVLGADQYIIPTESFARRPLVWLEKASEKRATILGSPNFGYRHCLRALGRTGQQALDLSRVRLIFNGAEPISPRLCEEFVASLAPHGLKANVMFPAYGLAEATLAVSFPEPCAELAVIHAERDSLGVGDAIRLQRESSDRTLSLVSVGDPVAGCAVRIVDARHTLLPDGHVGHVQIRGDNVMGGYYGRSGLLRDGFSDDGWLDTGDVGTCIDALYIVGRRKDTIILNGQNFHPHDIERLCEAAEGVETGKVACVGTRRDDAATDSVAVFVQHRGSLADFAPVANRIKTAVWDSAGLEVSDVVPVQSLPRTTSGKIQRFALRESFGRGTYAETLRALRAIARTDGSESRLMLSVIERTLKDICESVIRGRDIGVNDSLIDSGADSLALAEIQVAIDTLYPSLISIEDFLDYPTIAALALFMESKLATASDHADASRAVHQS